MGAAQLPATFAWNWNSLTGCVQGALAAVGADAPAAWIAGCTGDAFRVGGVDLIRPDAGSGTVSPGAAAAPGIMGAFEATGYRPRPLDDLPDALEALGWPVRVEARDLRTQGKPRFLTRRLKRAINAGRPVIAYGAGVADFVLLTGFDDAHRAYRLSGPLTDQVGPWLPYDALPNAGAPWLALLVPAQGHRSIPAPPAPPAVVAVRAAETARGAGSIVALEAWRDELAGDAPIDPPGHAYWAAHLAAARTEAAAFWRLVEQAGASEAGREGAGLDGGEVAAAYGAVALACSTFTTLFPYPAGGDVIGAGRIAGARALDAVIAAERRALDTLPPISPA